MHQFHLMYRRLVSVAAEPGQPLPTVFRVAGHPLRWRLLAELALSDRRVRELTGFVGRRQSLVSYHLRRLRAAGVVSTRRSSADGRDTYYTLELGRFADLLAEAGAALHPGLRLEPATPGPRMRPARVLFLCTGNSARSQIAEALLHELAGGTIRAVSAGSAPKPLHPNAVRTLRERGIDVSARHSKHLDTFRDERFDYVITLCDRVREVCPEFPGGPETIHWSIADPGAEPGDSYLAFERTAAELETRIRFLLRRIAA
jgi:protein-tyrosine-phosphatase